MMAARAQAYTRKLPPPPKVRPPAPVLDQVEAGEDSFWCRRCRALTPRRLAFLSRVERDPFGSVKVWIVGPCACASPGGPA